MSRQTTLLPTIAPTGNLTAVGTQRSPRQILPQRLNHKQLARAQLTCPGVGELPGLRRRLWRSRTCLVLMDSLEAAESQRCRMSKGKVRCPIPNPFILLHLLLPFVQACQRTGCKDLLKGKEALFQGAIPGSAQRWLLQLPLAAPEQFRVSAVFGRVSERHPIKYPTLHNAEHLVCPS